MASLFSPEELDTLFKMLYSKDRADQDLAAQIITSNYERYDESARARREQLEEKLSIEVVMHSLPWYLIENY